jgi:molecular chaperone IbpA|tara:strand:+ start:1237 stop:1650 length:414 start_codon:yes stop_codon:yes gene_type:complete
MIRSLIDWEPYRPFTVGFDSLMDRLTTIQMDAPSYPPYNIRKIDDFKYSIEVALAGFDKKSIDISYADNTLKIKSKKQDQEEKDIMHKGISQRAFTRSFCLAEDVIVNGAEFTNGMLSIELEKIVPEEKKPKTIKIK